MHEISLNTAGGELKAWLCTTFALSETKGEYHESWNGFLKCRDSTISCLAIVVVGYDKYGGIELVSNTSFLRSGTEVV